MKKLLLAFVLFIFLLQGFTQTETNVEILQMMSEEKSESYTKRKNEAIEFANKNNIPITFESNGVFFELQYIDNNDNPQYYKTDNINAAKTISTNKVYNGGGAGLSLDGTGITPRSWDAGNVRSTHQEYGGRVTNVNSSSNHYHSTHVAGTIMAAGFVTNAKGMAFNANLRAFDWYSDESEMASEASAGALMSNHSYGYVRGWYWNGSSWSWQGNYTYSNQEDYLFGFYNSDSQWWDQIAYNAPYYLICKSAGNDRNEGPGTNPPNDGPYDCIGTRGIAKNVLTVGAVNDISGGYSGPSSVVMSSFSSWGPADDGRIKPDIVANGVYLYSTDSDHDADYSSLSGTSMSTPSVTGSLALLQEHYENLNGSGNYMLAATTKALVIHTADEAGSYNGPDYEFGWGLMNTETAALKISEDQTLDVISEQVLSNGGTYTRNVTAVGTEPLKVTIVWTDYPGTPVSALLDPITPMIKNELDLRIEGAKTTYYPWKLDRNNPSNAATNSSENNVDNVEVVYIASPSTGTSYTITVDHDGTLTTGSQAFSIIISGILGGIPPVADFTANNTNPIVGQTVQFTDLSSNNPITWSWSFSPTDVIYVGGTNSNSQNPQVQFGSTGYYTVTLNASNGFGSDIETKVNYILVAGAPVADFSADNTTPLAGQTVQFTDLSSNTPTSWQWSYSPSTITYITGNQYSQNPSVQFTANGAYTVTLFVSNAYGSDTEIKTDYIHVGTPGLWTGATSTDWLTAENWENEQIPTSSDNVVIPATAVQWPTFSGNISLGTNCNNITLDGASQLTVTGDFTINSPRVLTISGTGTVNIGGTWLRYGNFSYGTGTINFYGNTDSNIDTYIGTTETFYNLTINKNLAKAKTLDDVNVLNDLTVNPNSWFTNNTGNTLNISADVFLKADNTGVFSFKDKGTTNIAGATYVEQYLTSERWHLVSPPVTGATINTYLAIYLKKYNEPTDTWTYLTEPTSTPMNTGQGYAAWASDNYTGTTTVSYTGTLNRNDLLLNTFDYTPAATNTGFNLIGNPFPCGIDWNSDPNWAMQDMSGWMVVYDNGIYKGQHTDGSDYNGKTDGHISPTQGFWVRATSSSAQLTIPTSERFHMDEPFYKDEQESKYPEIRLSCEIGSYVDETVVIFHPECSSGFDGYYDLAKFYNVSEAPQLYSITEGDNYAVNFQDPEYIKKIIPIGFTTANSGNYNLQVPSITKFDKNIFILLEDLKTGKTVNLKSFTTYNFDYSTDDNEHRFNLLFLKKNTSISNHKGSLSTHKESLTDNVDIYSYRNQVIVKTPSGSHGWIYVYDLLGEHIISNRIDENGLTQIQIGRNTGFYLVKVNTGDYFTSKKVFIR